MTIALLALLAAAAPTPAPAASPRSTKSLRAVRVQTPPRVDGVIDDTVWEAGEPVTDFVQQEPHVDAPATERTRVRVLYDDEALYFGVECFQRSPGGVVGRERRRDNALKDDDRFEIILDTFHDHRNGYHFVINPLGTQYDALITDEGHDINAEWDERWWSETRMTDQGWSAEIKIPFTSLRSRRGVDSWGINFRRFIRGKNEAVQWTGWDRDFSFLQVSQAGHLGGLDDVRPGLTLRVKPYAVGGFRRTPSSGRKAASAIDDVGLEVVKFSVTPGLTAELTANTDFAQTEVDEAVVNLTRFPLFFPEKREFFLERAGIFEFGPGGRRGGNVERNLQMFFSRRIGLTDDRRPVPIIGGGKLSGRLAGFDLGFLDVATDRFEGRPRSNYAVLRAKRNVRGRSNVGIFASDRLAGGRSANTVLGADANFSIFKNSDVAGFVGRSSTPGRRGNDWVGRGKFNYFTDRYEVFLEHLYVGPEFQHDLGFVRRRGIQRSDAAAIWQPRPEILNIRNFVFRGEVTYLTDIHRVLETREQIFQWTTRFQSDDAFRVNTTDTFDRLDAPFEISPGIRLPRGDYRFRDQFAEVEGSGKRPLSARLRLGGGDFYDGRRRYFQVAPVYKPLAALSVEAGYEAARVTLREGAFTTHVLNARLNFNPTNKWLTSALGQYDSASARWVVFFRLNYIYRPGDDVFLVFNRTTAGKTRPGEAADRALMLKWTRSFDF
jgi:Domain of unknown function (DUF5916)/Carbohydrate family 9 binding domain-like